MIGCQELIDLPKWSINRLRAKVDTGARICALDVNNLERTRGYVEFDVILSRDRRRTRRVRARISRTSRVRPSTGQTQTRYVVETKLRIGSIERTVEISLVPRKGMLCRMLIGRDALGRRFLVDPGSKLLARKRPTSEAG